MVQQHAVLPLMSDLNPRLRYVPSTLTLKNSTFCVGCGFNVVLQGDNNIARG